MMSTQFIAKKMCFIYGLIQTSKVMEFSCKLPCVRWTIMYKVIENKNLYLRLQEMFRPLPLLHTTGPRIHSTQHTNQESNTHLWKAIIKRGWRMWVRCRGVKLFLEGTRLTSQVTFYFIFTRFIWSIFLNFSGQNSTYMYVKWTTVCTVEKFIFKLF